MSTAVPRNRCSAAVEVVMTEVARRERRFYAIRNSRLAIDSTEVERSALAIASRAIASLIHTQGIGDLYEIATLARRDGAQFRLAASSPTASTRRPRTRSTAST